MRNIERTQEVGWSGESIERRANNRECSAKILTQHGVNFDARNMGAHLIVKHADQIVDFWPGTGKFIPRWNAKPGRGVFNLLKLLGVKA